LKTKYSCATLDVVSLLIVLALCSALQAQSEYVMPTSHKSFEFIAADGITALGLDLYQAANHESNPVVSPQAIVLFVHGGGFSSGSRNHPLNVLFCQRLAESGLHVACIDYRLLQKGKGFHCDVTTSQKREAISAAAQDIKCAASLLHSEFGYDVFLAGSSAGAHAALHAAYHQTTPEIRGVISMCGAMEPLADYPNVPLLAFHGTCDALVPYGEGMHHYCARNQPGALLLQGSGALADCLPQVELHSYLYANHDLANALLNDQDCAAACVNFVQRVLNGQKISGTFLFEGSDTCKLVAPYLPCQQ